jgi:hypothetical protein
LFDPSLKEGKPIIIDDEALKIFHLSPVKKSDYKNTKGYAHEKDQKH